MSLSGLSSAEVAAKIKQGRTNQIPRQNSHSIQKIITRNLFTIFNLVNLILALMVLFVGSYKNLLFIFIAIANTLIAIVNEIRAKKTIDKMRLLAEQRPTVIRDGKNLQIDPNEIVDGDLLIFGLGDQILVDSEIKEGTIEVNESFITGESDNIKKQPGDKLISGSFVVSGICKATAISVGAENYISKLESSAHTIKTADSKLFKIMNNIVKYISFVLIPIGALLLWSRFRIEGETTEIAVTSTVAALINMIPEGLILLTSSVLALSTIRLSRQKVLVQDLYSIETLARVDCIALDKTGTLTTGNLTVKNFIPVSDGKLLSPTDLKNPQNRAEKALQNTLKLILSHDTANNATSTALKGELLKNTKFEPTEQILETIPFSSDRKYSGVKTKKAIYLMGAPEFLTDQKYDIEGNYRILAVVKCEEYPRSRSIFSDGENTERALPVTTGESERSENDGYPRISSKLIGLILFEDELRKDAKNIINYFYDNDVDIKIISGDNQNTVENIAALAGVKNINSIDLSNLKTPIDYDKLVEDYNIFTRVKPSQKKSLILALKKQGKTVAMTGDGVNDILAMKEADCSIAIGEGSDAARKSAKLVLLSSDFSAFPKIIDEGRQTINNLERSTALFLAKTVYASILAVLFVFLPLRYPFTPIEMTLLNFTCIGFPAFILALEKNTDRIKNRFAKNIMQYSVPIGLTVTICTLILSILAHVNDFSHFELTTTSVFVTFTIDLILIYWISRPLNLLRATLLLTIIGIMVATFLIPFTRQFFEFTFLTENGLVVTISVAAIGILIFAIIRRLMYRLSARVFKTRPHLNL
ncbi:HAD-IC family P-type ATPase [Candidatus Saccharibacteria bacterium]|nr:HAD-IC family P-type ATPase [Candidatus Saccharibacteria bacterium]